jgi:hypothetical protein
VKTNERTIGVVSLPRAGLRCGKAGSAAVAGAATSVASRLASALLAALCLMGTLAGASGCGGFFYALNTTAATSKIEKAQALGAEKYAPFEFYSAQEHLKKAMEEAAAADYGHAIHYADSAETYADKAIALAQKAHEGAGR